MTSPTPSDVTSPSGDASVRSADSPNNVDSLSYEQARDELARIVTALETGRSTLEESLTLWERGEALAARCQEWLDAAQLRLDAAITPDAVITPGNASPPPEN